MQKTRNRLVAALLTLAMCLGVVSPLSAFAEGDATQVGTAEALATAVASANASIQLTDSVTLTDTLTVTGNVTLDLNEKTLDGTELTNVITVEDGGTLTLKNGTLKANSESYAIIVEANGTLTAENVRICDTAVGIDTVGSVTLSNCRIETSKESIVACGISVGGGSCTISNNTVIQGDAGQYGTQYGGMGVSIQAVSDVTFAMDGGSISGTKIGVQIEKADEDAVTVAFNGVSITATDDDSTGVDAQGGTVTIKGGTITAPTAISGTTDDEGKANVTIADTTVNGTIKGVEASALIDESQYVTKDENGTYTVVTRTELKWAQSEEQPTLNDDGVTYNGTFTIEVPTGNDDAAKAAAEIVTGINEKLGSTWAADENGNGLYPTAATLDDNTEIKSSADLIEYVNTKLKDTPYMIKTVPALSSGDASGDLKTEPGQTPAKAKENNTGAIVAIGAVAVAAAVGGVIAYNWDKLPVHKLEGTVVDANGEAVAGATVEIAKAGVAVKTVTTDANGHYQAYVAKGEYTLTAAAGEASATAEGGPGASVQLAVA